MPDKDMTSGLLDFGNPQPVNEDRNNGLLHFGEPSKRNNIIKVVGIGGGGGNAVNHMYREGIEDVSFVVCNTDHQALNDSPVPVHLQLGKDGLGAGNKPEKARIAAEESAEDITNMLNDGTKMAFITAGMGGGTGTGAAPVVARISKELGILTVGIVTIPFAWEGAKKIDQALDGVEEMSKYVDALLVINNARLSDLYPDFSVIDAFAKADNTLSVAARSISDLITQHGIINLDFKDVETVLKDGGVAIMSTGYGEGDGRVKNAIQDALNSPLLNHNDVFNSKKILLNITFAKENEEQSGLMMDEMNDVHDFMAKFGNDFEIKWGLSIDQSLGKKVKITILATGFGVEHIDGMNNHIHKHTVEEIERIAYEEEQKIKNLERRERFYNNESNGTQHKSRPQIYIFSSEDLDNDDVINAIENIPTKNRTRPMLEEIKKMSSGITQKPTEDLPQENIQGPIQFD